MATAAATVHSFNIQRGAPGTSTRGSCVPALRVSQLDATELDAQLTAHLAGFAADAVRFWPAGAAALSLHTAWLRATVQLLLSGVLLRREAATYGMRLLGLRYQRVHPSQPQLTPADGAPALGQRRYLLLLLGVLLQAAQQAALGGGAGRGRRGCWQRLATGAAVLQLLTAMAFLQRGLFQFWWERLLALRKVYRAVEGAPAPSFEFTERELLWHGAAELLTGLALPLGRQLLRLRRSAPGTQAPDGSCPVCTEPRPQQPVCPVAPVLPVCAHPVCYMCAAGQVAAQGVYRCTRCGAEASACQQLRHWCLLSGTVGEKTRTSEPDV